MPAQQYTRQESVQAIAAAVTRHQATGIGYNVAMLKCPECPTVVMSLSDATGDPQTDAATVAAFRQEARQGLAAHLLEHP